MLINLNVGKQQATYRMKIKCFQNEKHEYDSKLECIKSCTLKHSGVCPFSNFRTWFSYI